MSRGRYRQTDRQRESRGKCEKTRDLGDRKTKERILNVLEYSPYLLPLQRNNFFLVDKTEFLVGFCRNRKYFVLI